MGAKHYDEQFRRRAVDLYESTPGATVAVIAADLGVSVSSLWKWIKAYGTGKRTPKLGSADPASALETPLQKIARLEAENLQLRADRTKLQTEKEILKAAAKYFAGETNW